MILVSAENLFRICPRGVMSKNLRGKQFVKCPLLCRRSKIWMMRRSRMWTERQISLRLGSATWWGHGWSCSAGCDAGSWPMKDPETPLWARWWGTKRSLQRTRRWRPNSRGRPVTIATHERIQRFSATHQEMLISSLSQRLLKHENIYFHMNHRATELFRVFHLTCKIHSDFFFFFNHILNMERRK